LSSYDEERGYDPAFEHGFDHDETRPTRPRQHRPARKPKRKRSVHDLRLAQGAEGATSTTAFADPDLQGLYERGYFDTLLGEVKGGKEATVYLVAREGRRLAAKIYADIETRAFRDDAVYWNDVFIGDRRTAKAMKNKTRAGRRAQQAIWVAREYAYLWRLVEAGVPVPRPAVGPEPSVYGAAGSVVLMEFVGEGDDPAPRLSDVRLDREDAKDAYRQSAGILVRLAALGLVHGDFSTYNLLWHDGKVVLIDVPQMMELAVSRSARGLLERDVHTLVASFRRLRVQADPRALLAEALGAAISSL
jgi:RIO kinase 1